MVNRWIVGTMAAAVMAVPCAGMAHARYTGRMPAGIAAQSTSVATPTVAYKHKAAAKKHAAKHTAKRSAHKRAHKHAAA